MVGVDGVADKGRGGGFAGEEFLLLFVVFLLAIVVVSLGVLIFLVAISLLAIFRAVSTDSLVSGPLPDSRNLLGVGVLHSL